MPSHQQRAEEKVICVRQNVSALCGGLGGAAHQQSFLLFNFSTVVYK